MSIAADHYTPVDDGLIPTGAVAPVLGTSFDFASAPRTIGERIAELGRGYDHNFVLRGPYGQPAAPREVAVVTEPLSGRRMRVRTTEPGMQFYTGNFLDGTAIGKRSTAYVQHSGFCMETQHFPDAINQPALAGYNGAGDTVLRPGQVYRHTTVYAFDAV